MKPLHPSSLELVNSIPIPRYSRTFQRRICHLGPGNFHRAHQAWYLHRLLQENRGEGWGISGIFLMPADQPRLQALQEQHGLFSLWQLEGRKEQGEIIGSLMELVDATQDSELAIETLADSKTHIVSLTITEKGYYLNAHQQLDTNHPEIANDLSNPTKPRTAIGLLVHSLALRKQRQLPPFTVMSCDNLLDNGHKAREAVLGYAAKIDTSLKQWIAAQVAFPCSMVDRITPAPDPERCWQLLQSVGVEDRSALYCESWHQWVLEDRFPQGRPGWEFVGATFTNQVSRFEQMKVSLLNGGHSILCHRALLAGYKTVHEAASEPEITQWLWRYWESVMQTLTPIADVDYRHYCDTLLGRFRNSAIEDQLLRLAEDSRSKLQQCLLPSLNDCYMRNQDTSVYCEALAYWIHFLASEPENYRDNDAEQLIHNAKQALINKNSHKFLTFAFGAFDQGIASQVDSQFKDR